MVANDSPSMASTRNTSRALPSDAIASTTTPEVPVSCSSYLASRPDSPATSPGW